MSKWTQLGLQPPVEHQVANQFRFGNGQVEVSQRSVDLPVGLNGRRGVLQAAVVKGAAPLLVSRLALKRLKANLDFEDGKLILFKEKVEIPLQVNAAGQYIVDMIQFPENETTVAALTPEAHTESPDGSADSVSDPIIDKSSQPKPTWVR